MDVGNPTGPSTIALQSLEGLNRAGALDLWLDVSAVPHNPQTSESLWNSGPGSMSNDGFSLRMESPE